MMAIKDWDQEILGLCLLGAGLVCLGTWPALVQFAPIQDRSSAATVLVENAGARRAGYHRAICSMNLDLATSFFVVSLVPFILALILATKSTDLLSGLKSPLIVFALIGGFLLGFGHLAVQWTSSVYGPPLPVTQAIQASIAILLGTATNHQLQPGMTSDDGFLVIGVGALLVGTLAFSRAERERLHQASLSLGRTTGNNMQLTMRATPDGAKRQIQRGDDTNTTDDDEESTTSAKKEKKKSAKKQKGTLVKDLNDSDAGTAADTETATESEDPLVSRPPAEVPSTSLPRRRQTCPEVFVAVSSGMAFGLCSTFFNVAVNDPFQWSGEEWKKTDDVLCVARTHTLFALGFWLTSVIGNLIRLHVELPTENRLESPIRRAVREYLSKESFTESEQWAILAGMVFAFGIMLQFQGGKMVGYTTAELAQGAPMVSTVWTLTALRYTQLEMNCWLGSMYFVMFAAYAGGVGCYVCSRILSIF